MNKTNTTTAWNHLPFVTQAMTRWYRGTDRREAQSATWYRAMATRLHCAAEQTGSEAAAKAAEMARECAAVAA